MRAMSLTTSLNQLPAHKSLSKRFKPNVNAEELNQVLGVKGEADTPLNQPSQADSRCSSPSSLGPPLVSNALPLSPLCRRSHWGEPLKEHASTIARIPRGPHLWRERERRLCRQRSHDHPPRSGIWHCHAMDGAAPLPWAPCQNPPQFALPSPLNTTGEQPPRS